MINCYWIRTVRENKTDNGNFKLRPFTENWNYKPERAIDKMDIVGINEEGARDKLLNSLEKGNRHQVTAMKDGKEVKLYLAANPAEHRVNLTNYKGEPQKLEHYKKPEFKNDQKQAQQQEDAPEKNLYVCEKTVHTKTNQRMWFGTFLDAQGNFFDTVHFPNRTASYPFRGAGC